MAESAEAERGAARAAKRVLVIDGNLLAREGVAELLQRRGIDTETAGPAPVEAAAAARHFVPDAVLVHASNDALGEIIESMRCPVIVYGVADTAPAVTRCIELQPAAFMLESEPASRLFTLLETARANAPQCPPTVVPLLLRLVAGRGAGAESATRDLTAREREVLDLLHDGFANKEIAVKLGITTRTVKNHLHNVYDKLHVHSRAEATARVRGVSRPSAAG